MYSIASSLNNSKRNILNVLIKKSNKNNDLAENNTIFSCRIVPAEIVQCFQEVTGARNFGRVECLSSTCGFQ